MTLAKSATQKNARSANMDGKTIRAIAVNEGVTLTELASRLGISRQALYKRLNGDMKTSSFESCVRAMGYDLYYGKDGKVRKI